MLSATTEGRRASRPNQCRMGVWVQAAAARRQWARRLSGYEGGDGCVTRLSAAETRKNEVRELVRNGLRNDWAKEGAG
jgi:hypothetical protein